MSLKILINNEEVVCNSNIQINEEMLSTSSTILKNCYPKSWEDDKDYTSRYYFPKDYSKCKIINNKPIDFEIVGETTQNGTPTPDEPVPIINKSGIIQETIGGLPYTFNLGDIELCKIGDYQDSIKKSNGKNLCDEIFESGNINDSGEETTSSTTYRSTNYYSVKGGETLICSYNVTTGTNLNWCACYDSNKNFLRRLTNIKTDPFTISNDTAYIRLGFYKSGSITRNDFSNVMLNESSTALPYEPYGKVWYIEKQTGRYDIDTSQITLGSSYTNLDYAQIPKPNTFLGYSKYDKTEIKCNMASWLEMATSGWNDSNIINKISGNANKWVWFLGFTKGTTLSAIQTALTGSYIIYPLATPTTTEITDPTLLEQLNSVGQRLLFCGCIKNTGNINLNPRQPHFVDLQVLDFKTLLSEGETLNYVITGKTIVEAINQVVNSISDYGFIVGNIQILNPNDIINAYSTLNKTAYDVFQYIADITQSRWTTRMIDENTIAIDFYDPSLMPTGVDIDKTQTFYENYKIIDMSFNYSTNDYRNKQIMTSDEVYANITQTETIIADGYATSFMCQNKIGLITSITLNGVEKTFATKSEEQLGITADFVYQPGETTFTSNDPIGAGGVIVITYYPIVKGREIILNNVESNRIESQINRNGTISRYENRNDTTSSQELQKIGQSYIKYKGKAEINLKIVSELNTWNVGEIVSYNAPISELSTTYMVKSKQISMYLNANKIIYTYNLTSNYNCENAVNYFDNQRAKNQGNIGEGETITRNIDLENEALILFYDTEINEIQVQNPTSLDFALDGVLI